MGMTLDQAITELEILRKKLGGGTQLVIRGYAMGYYAKPIDVFRSAVVGRSDPTKFVSFGGVPVVFING